MWRSWRDGLRWRQGRAIARSLGLRMWRECCMIWGNIIHNGSNGPSNTSAERAVLFQIALSHARTTTRAAKLIANWKLR